jgi:hypothetical protein
VTTRSIHLLRALWLLIGAIILPACAQDAASVHRRFTNDDVIILVHMNLAEDVIVSKIRAMSSADPSALRFDTSVEGLKALKDANVPDVVIRVMINPAAAQATVITQAAPITLDPNLPPPEVGVYWEDQSRFILIEGQMLAKPRSAARPAVCSAMGFAACTGTLR